MLDALIKSIGNTQEWSNWSGTVQNQVANIFYPTTETEVAAVILKAKEVGKRIRVAGSGHSFSQLMQSEEYIVSLVKMKGLIQVDKTKKQATVWAGTSIKEANEALFKQGLAMINLGDVDIQSMAGATATGTHGTGMAFGNISTDILHFTLVTAAGDILECSAAENQEIFEAGRISLGALGIITKITFQLDDAYKLEYVCKAGDFYETVAQIKDYNQQNRNFEFYYFPFSDIVQLKLSNKTEAATKHNKLMAHINDVFVENTVLQLACKLGKNFPSLRKTISRLMSKGFPKGTTIDYSYQIYATVRNVRFKEMEYNIPLEHFEEVVTKMKEMIEEKEYFVFFPIECRFVKQDNIWLSPAYGRDSAYIAIHVYNQTPHDPYFEELEALFLSYEGRPHWGKMHTRNYKHFEKCYPKWQDFISLRKKLDPTGVFLNQHLEDVFGL